MRRRPSLVLVGALGAALALGSAPPSSAGPVTTSSHADAASHADAVSAGVAAAPQLPKPAVQRGYGGAVTSVDPDASRVGLKVLRRGGNAVDAAIATAAALGVTEPFSTGVGGGGYFVYYDAITGRVSTIDGRETAPAAMPRDAFINPDTGKPYPFTPELVTSGVSVGTPGTPATWVEALRRWGSRPLRAALAPAARLADRGFVVDDTFRSQTADNRERFRAFRSTTRLYLRNGRLPKVGTRFRNPALARTYRAFGRNPRLFSHGALPREIARAVQRPPTVRRPRLPVPKGYLTARDQRRYRVISQRPTEIDYRGNQVFGMRPSSSGGTTVGEALNVLEGFDLASMTPVEALHHYLEAGAIAFADRGAYVGDRRYVDVPTRELLSQDFADERACTIDPDTAADKPVAAGDVTDYDGDCATPSGQAATSDDDTENISTSHLTVADRHGNVVSYTLTIEQTGGSGIVVPGRGFLLNNELTDFSTVYDADDPNRIEPGKRPRSSMSPTIVLRDGEPFLALGSPGGSTIITTVLQTLVNRLDLGMSLPEAVAAPRASPRNTAEVTAEPAFIDAYGDQLAAYGHDLVSAGDAFTSAAEIGALTGIEFGPNGLLTAVAEPERRGGGAARALR